MNKEIEIPEGHEARIEGNKVIIVPIDSEDERIRKMLVKYFEFYRSHPDLTLDVNTWQGEKVSDILAYLEKQKEQKPAEWSDEDEKKINGLYNAVILIRDLVHTGELKSTDRYKVEKYYEELASWLKSLRPRHITYALDAPLGYDKDMNPIYPPINHWKPTEKQIAALEWQIKNTYDGSWQRKESESLYDDLKKL